MSDTADTAQVIIRRPLVWALAVIAGFALNWLVPLPFVPAAVPAGWLGGPVFVLALALFAWAIPRFSLNLRWVSPLSLNSRTNSAICSRLRRFLRGFFSILHSLSPSTPLKSSSKLLDAVNRTLTKN
jgi:hypothetical protein